jgi:hypothetical protein
MASEFVEGSAHFNNAFLEAKYTTAFFAGVDLAPPVGRIGPAIELNAGGFVTRTLKHQSGWTIGFARYFQASVFGNDIYQGRHNNTIIARVTVENDGTISLRCGNGTFIANSTPFSLHAKSWYDIQCQYTLTGSPTTNIMVTMELKVDGNILCSGTGDCGFNTTVTLLNTATVNVHSWSSPSGNNWQKDSYCFNNLTANNNSYAGDLTFLAIFPNGDVSTGWTPSRAGTSWDLINSNPPDLTKYIEEATAGVFSNFDFQDVPAFSGKIVVVQILALAQKTAEGSKSFKIKSNPGAGAIDFSSAEFFVNDSPLYYFSDLGQDPAGGDWDVTAFNARRWRVEVIS